MVELPDFITPKELARQLNCSERKLREISRRIGCYHVIGNTIFFTQEDVHEFLDAVRVPKTGKGPRDMDEIVDEVNRRHRADTNTIMSAAKISSEEAMSLLEKRLAQAKKAAKKKPKLIRPS